MNLVFFVMITVKERIDSKEMQIDEFSIYDFYSEPKEKQNSLDNSSKSSVENNPIITSSQYKVNNKKSSGSPSTVSIRTFRSHYQMTNYSINDLYGFVSAVLQKSNNNSTYSYFSSTKTQYNSATL